MRSATLQSAAEPVSVCAAMFRGAFTALVTPFVNGQLDEAALTKLVETQIAGGIDGLVPCGTTGESAVLSHDEHLRVVELVTRGAAGRVPVIAGAGSNNTAEAIRLARACRDLGVAATLQITPYYNKPTQEGLVRHMTEVAESSGLPIVMYNVPGRTGCDMLPETVARLAEHELIVGIKEATGSMARASRVRELCGPNFDLLSGDDFTTLPLLAVGGHGVISVITNVVPGLFAHMCAAAAKDDWDHARELHYKVMPLLRSLFSVANPIPTKLALHLMGQIEPELRSPMHTLEESSPHYRELHTQLRNLELIK